MYPSALNDKIIHERTRLLILLSLASTPTHTMQFTQLQKQLSLSAGNLSIQLKTLKKAQYIDIKKEFLHDKPNTKAELTIHGKNALSKYLSEMELIIKTYQ